MALVEILSVEDREKLGILMQYANSPTMLKLIASFWGSIEPGKPAIGAMRTEVDLQNFYNHIVNLGIINFGSPSVPLGVQYYIPMNVARILVATSLQGQTIPSGTIFTRTDGATTYTITTYEDIVTNTSSGGVWNGIARGTITPSNDSLMPLDSFSPSSSIPNFVEARIVTFGSPISFSTSTSPQRLYNRTTSKALEYGAQGTFIDLPIRPDGEEAGDVITQQLNIPEPLSGLATKWDTVYPQGEGDGDPDVDDWILGAFEQVQDVYLDWWGEILGISRQIKYKVPPSTDYTEQELSDDDYRTILRAKAYSNLSNSSLDSLNRIADIIVSPSGGKAWYEEYTTDVERYNPVDGTTTIVTEMMKLVVRTSGTIAPEDMWRVYLLNEKYIMPIGMAVGVGDGTNPIYPQDVIQVFGFINNDVPADDPFPIKESHGMQQYFFPFSFPATKPVGSTDPLDDPDKSNGTFWKF